MKLDKIINKTQKKKSIIDMREAFNLWDILKSKYDNIEKMETYKNFAHDLDFVYILDKLLTDYKKNIKVLENLLEKYKVKGPDQGRGTINYLEQTDIYRDELMASDILVYIQEHMENMLRCFRTSATNDKVRLVITDMLKKTLNDSELIYKYIKLKGWIGVPPMYKNAPKDLNEQLSTAEASNLWDHLTFRYDNMRQNRICIELVNDTDFKIVLDRGISILAGQIEQLENECIKFGLPLPKRPAKVLVTDKKTELFNDDLIYRTTLIGLQAATIMHIDSQKQCIINDRLRGIFLDMLIEEIDFINSFIKYGKSKGWLNPTPIYTS